MYIYRICNALTTLVGSARLFVNETNRTRSLSRDKNFEKNTKTPFFPPNRKTCRKKHKKKRDSNSWLPLHLKQIPNNWDTNDLQKKRKFRRTLYLLTNKKESVVLGSFTFESSTMNLRHMLGPYVSSRNTRKKLLFLPGHKERVLSVSHLLWFFHHLYYSTYMGL